MDTTPEQHASEVSGRRLVRNTAANAAGSLTVAVLAVVMTPFFLRRLGPAEYGVWLLATTLTFANGYLGFADLGLQQAGVRFIAEARRRADLAAINRLLSTMLALFAGLGVALGITLALVAGALARLFTVDPGLESAAQTVFMLVGLQVAFDLPAAAFLSVIEGAQSYGRLRIVEVGARLLWAVVVVFVVIAGGGAVAMAVVSLAVAALLFAVTVLFARQVQPGLRPSWRDADLGTLREVLGQAGSLLVLKISGVVYRQMDRAIIGVALAAAAVAEYEVAYKIHATAAIMLSVAPSAVMPAAAYLGAADDLGQLRTLYLRGTKYALAMATSVSLAAMIHARPLIATWVGSAYTDLTATTQLFLSYPILVSVHVIGLTMLVGLGRMREMVVLSPAAIVLNLIVSLALVSRVGVIGVVWGTVIGYLVLWVPYLRIMLKAFEVSVGTWVREVLAPNLPGAAVQVGVGLAVMGRVDGFGQLWQVGLAIGVSAGLNLACLMIVIGADERRNLTAALRGRGAVSPGAASAG